MKHTVEEVKQCIRKTELTLLEKTMYHTREDLLIIEEALHRYKAHLEGKAYHVEVRPIEEAPKDGTRIFCIMPSGYEAILEWSKDGYWRRMVGDRPNKWRPENYLTFNGSPKLPVIEEE